MMGPAMILRSIGLGAGLAMDAFSVSLANGLKESRMSPARMSLIAGVYAFFQFAMPMIGWVCVVNIARAFVAFEKLIPWIALILLLYIGGKMIVEGVRERREQAYGSGVAKSDDVGKAITPGTLIMQGIATSIDALSVGFAFAEYDWKTALGCAVIIAVVTFVICIGGLSIGRRVGTRLSGNAELLGGTILILIGIEIFVKGVFF